MFIHCPFFYYIVGTLTWLTHGYKSKDALQKYLHEFCYRYNHGKSFDYIWKNGTHTHTPLHATWATPITHSMVTLTKMINEKYLRKF